ncbi:MAG TPA: hypothetical protein VK962_03455 [Actinomycetota bacterium]|nr:hypothetical protein [Actinomycetota bacterium]
MSRGIDAAAEAAPLREYALRLAELLGLAGQTLESLRRLSRDLRPTVLDDLGLVPALEWVADLRHRTCSGKRVVRLMRAAGLHGIPSRRRRGLTRRRPGVAPHPDLVQRQFAAEELDRLWVADISLRADG